MPGWDGVEDDSGTEWIEEAENGHLASSTTGCTDPHKDIGIVSSPEEAHCSNNWEGHSRGPRTGSFEGWWLLVGCQLVGCRLVGCWFVDWVIDHRHSVPVPLSSSIHTSASSPVIVAEIKLFKSHSGLNFDLNLMVPRGENDPACIRMKQHGH